MFKFRKLMRLAGLLVLAVPCVRADYTAVVNPASILVTNYQGWGSSLCWWANVVGGYSNRQEYCTLAFSDLKLNIVRYNIGGGENPSLTNTITNYRAIMQGFEPTNGVWNWNADQNQRWVLRQALAEGANLVDAFANSPPWWMTISGSVTGNTNTTGSQNDNLQTNYEAAFAAYLATVVSNLTVLDGDHFNYCTPMNEPVGTDWLFDNGKQEGCDIDPGQQARLVNDLRAQLNVQSPSTGIDAAEDFSESDSFSDLNSYTNGAFPYVSLVSTHTYSANDAGPLGNVAVSSRKPLWVSEYGDGDATGLIMAQRIHDDITGMGASAWVYWQVVDNAGGWGFLYNPLVAPTNSSFTTNYTINQKFYVMGQFSEFVSRGCNIISVNDSYTLAAFNPTNSTLVLVMANTNTSGFDVTYNLGAFTSLPAQVAVYQTAGALGEDITSLPSLPVLAGEFTAAIPAQSVTTFVLSNVSLAPVILAQSAGSAPTNYLDLYVGANASLSVSAAGSAPLGYQWFANGAALGGATNAVFLPSAAAQGTNFYQCIVTNFAGAATSSVWAISVLAPPAAPYPLALLALHPSGYWRLDETPNNGSGNQGVVCHDYVGGNNGVYSNAVLAQAGYNPSTDPAEKAALFGSYLSTNSAASQIGNNDFSGPPGGDAEFSIVAWVKASAQTNDSGIVAKGYGSGGEQFVLDTGSDSVATHGFRFFVRNAFGVTSVAAATNMPDGNWHHLAGICDESNGMVHLYVDGVDRADGSMWPGMALLETSGGDAPGDPAISIGSRSGSMTAPSLNNQFDGTIDDVAVFPSALTAAQMETLYAAPPSITSQLPLPYTNLFTLYAGANPSFMVSVSGAAPAYQWFTNGVPVLAATNPVLTLNNVQTGFLTNDCVIQNVGGAVTSMVWTASITTATNDYPLTLMSLNPVAYWRLNEFGGAALANDYAGGASAVYGASTTSGLPGVPSAGFANEVSVAMEHNASTVGAGCLTNGGLILNTNSVTFLCWVFPFTNQFNPSGLLFCRSGGAVAGDQIGGAEALDYTWSNNSQTYDYGSGLLVPTNTWSLVALAVTPSNAVLYVANTNGLVSATNSVANPVQSFFDGIAIGADPQSTSRIFNGKMDEAAILNYAISAAQLGQLYAAATNATLPPNANPTNILVAIVNNQLKLGWPADHIGWQLQVQTNSLTGTNWVNVNGSTSTNQFTIPINPANPSVFYRLVYP